MSLALYTEVTAQCLERPSSLRKRSSMKKNRITVFHYGHKQTKRYTMFIKERLYISKMSVLPRITYRFNAMPMKTQHANSSTYIV